MEQQSDITSSNGRGVTVGTFDGIHRGHMEVVEFLIKESRQRGLTPLIITFDPHPLTIIAPDRAPRLLESAEERARVLRSFGAEVVIMPFDEKLRRQTVAQWFARLTSEFNVKMVVTGFDNTFGSDGKGLHYSDYASIGADNGIEVIEAPRLEGVSSTLIRQALTNGDVDSATKMLGHPYSVTGIVAHGRELGRTIGVPTANLIPNPDLLIPSAGVYAGEVIISNTKHRAVVNIGVAPTVAEGLPLTIEAHILNFNGDIYGAPLRIEFLKRLRDERHFDSLDTLKAQITLDIASASTILP